MSDLPPGFVSGWISDPNRVNDSIMDRAAKGDAVMGATFVARHENTLPGTWNRLKSSGRTGVFLRDVEPLLLGGKHRRPWLQRAGTCVSRGTGRGVQTSLDVAVFNNAALLKDVEVTFAPIYSLARHEVGRDRCGSGDGAILADAMWAIHDYGVASVDLFTGMSEDDIERMAVKYASPGVGTPSNWILASQGHTCITFWPETLDLLCDCLAAGYAVPYAHNYVTGMPNKDGISDLGSFGPHCRCFTGVALDQSGNLLLLSSESWGRFPAGQPTNDDQTMPVEQIPCVTLRYAGGEKKLAPGEVAVNANRFWEQIQQGGEAWAVSPPRFEANGIADLIRKGSAV